jgi:hypothetical protein
MRNIRDYTYCLASPPVTQLSHHRGVDVAHTTDCGSMLHGYGVERCCEHEDSRRLQVLVLCAS